MGLLAACTWTVCLCQSTLSFVVTARDFIDFCAAVNYGNNYLGTTVFLEEDIDFSGNLSNRFRPAGDCDVHAGSDCNCFLGTFDGQGHRVSNLAIRTTATGTTGVFGHSFGMTIKNLVLDASCTVTNTYNSQDAVYAGGILGGCWAAKGPCAVEGVVNMGEVRFAGNVGDRGLWMGGICGRLNGAEHGAWVMNSPNYGDVTYAGTSDSWERIGGVIGECYWSNTGNSSSSSSSSPGCRVVNSPNYGTVTYTAGPRSNTQIGGIVGQAHTTVFENCLSAGRLVVNTTANPQHSSPRKICVGSVLGHDDSSDQEKPEVGTNIKHCFWDKNVGTDKACGEIGKGTTVNDASLVESLGIDLVDKLNRYVAQSSEGLSRWLMLHTNGGSFSGLGNKGNKTIAVTHKDFPGPRIEGLRFDFWCKDIGCREQYAPDAGSGAAAGITDLYAHYTGNIYTVTFNPAGGRLTNEAAQQKSVTYGKEYGTLQEAKRTGHTFSGWFTGYYGTGDRITSKTIVSVPKDHTLYAAYAPSNYTVTFDPAGGNVSATHKNVTYGEKYGELPSAGKTGHTFCGWHTNRGAKVTAETLMLDPIDNVLHAKWTVGTYLLTFDFRNGTRAVEAHMYGDAVHYPPDPVWAGHTFRGWDRHLATMPGRNTTIRSLWAGSGGRSTQEVAGAAINIISGFVGICTVGLAVAFVVFETKRFAGLNNTENLEASTEERTDVGPMTRWGGSRAEDWDWDRHRDRAAAIPETSPSDIEKCTDAYSPTTATSSGCKKSKIAEALRSAGVNWAQARRAAETCIQAGVRAAQRGWLFDGFTAEDAAAVALYTLDFGPNGYAYNPYRLINRALIRTTEELKTKGINAEEAMKTTGVGRLALTVMQALRKLPRTTGRTLYRGLREAVDTSTYMEDEVVVWHGLSSTSPDIKAVKAFLAKGSKSGKASGTLFVIENGWGYDLQPYSLFPDEEEVLLEPGRNFRVQGIIESGVTIVKLKMLDTPLIQFGKGAAANRKR